METTPLYPQGRYTQLALCELYGMTRSNPGSLSNSTFVPYETQGWVNSTRLQRLDRHGFIEMSHVHREGNLVVLTRLGVKAAEWLILHGMDKSRNFTDGEILVHGEDHEMRVRIHETKRHFDGVVATFYRLRKDGNPDKRFNSWRSVIGPFWIRAS